VFEIGSVKIQEIKKYSGDYMDLENKSFISISWKKN